MVTTPLQLSKDEIFTCPIYRGHNKEFMYLDTESDKIIDRLEKHHKEKLKKKEITELPNSYHSENLWQYKEWQPFCEYVMQQMWNILHWQGYELKGFRPLLQECWVQEFPKEGGFHDIHIHSRNQMSGFYFLKCSSKTSKPWFHDPRPGKMMTDLRIDDERIKTAPKKLNHCSSKIFYDVKPGDFVFFNSYMPHSYQHHKGNDKFRFVHFNMTTALDAVQNIENKEEK
tara:strand:+ start:2560 stop:3243 length:684 start_codon:yes stop_codon:yes gene_type:complete